MASNYYEKLIEEMNRRNPGGLPEDALTRLPTSITDEFDSRLPQPDIPVAPTAPTVPTSDIRLESLPAPDISSRNLPPLDISSENLPAPDISSENIPEPTFQAPPIPESSSFDVNVSTRTPRMEGREESLPSLAGLPESSKLPERRWELEDDDPTPLPETTPTPTPTDAPAASGREAADAALLSTGQDEKERARLLAELEKKRKFQVIPQTIAGIGDAISSSASAFGGNAPGGSMQRMIDRQDKQYAQGKLDIENKLRNDPNSDISKQYQNLVAQFLQKDVADPAVLGLTANQIAEKLPAIEKVAQMRQAEELTRLALTAKSDESKMSPASKKFDQEMAKLTAEFVDSGGIKVAKQAVNQLQKSIDSFKKLGPGLLSRVTAALSPDAMRGLVQPQYKSIEQEVRQNVTELLRSTLGAQFTEREGERIFSQTFDPTLPMKINLTRMEALRDKLNAIADERARSVQYFTKHGTFKDYEPQSSLQWTYDAPIDMSEPPKSRQTKSGYTYSVD